MPEKGTDAITAWRPLASLITESWNQLVEWLKRIDSLREWVKDDPK